MLQREIEKKLIDSEGKLYKLTISTGIDTVNIYEGD